MGSAYGVDAYGGLLNRDLSGLISAGAKTAAIPEV